MSDRIIVKSIFREYSVNFIEDFIPPLVKKVNNGAFLILDANVFRLYKKQISPVLSGNNFFIVEPNENNKTIDKCREIIEVLVENKVRRNQELIAIGGGIIQDITAFTASITYRGIEWSFFPTTLLAQADSCIGSKTSINLKDKKNLIGNFYPPSSIYIDTTFLKSLEIDDIKSGIGEILHFYFYANSPLVNKLISNYHDALNNRALLIEYMKESLSIKKKVVEIDEFDKNERNKFNYGHTFGHAIESVTNYTIKHGQAVTIGMDIANYISVKMGIMDRKIFDKIHSILSMNFPYFNWEKFNFESYFNALSKDKKNIGDNLGCVLAERPGILMKKQVPINNEFKDWIRTYFVEELTK